MEFRERQGKAWARAGQGRRGSGGAWGSLATLGWAGPPRIVVTA